MLFFQRRLEASVIKPHSPRFQPLPNDLSVRNIVWLWGAEPGGTPGAPVSLGVQVTAGLTGCFVVCDYWKPTLTISENGRRVLEPSSIFYGHDLQSQQSSSTCKMCLCVCTCSVCMCVCVYAREHVQCWDGPRASHTLNKLSTTELHPQLFPDRISLSCAGWSWNSPYSPSRPRSHKSSCLSHPNSWD